MSTRSTSGRTETRQFDSVAFSVRVSAFRSVSDASSPAWPSICLAAARYLSSCRWPTGPARPRQASRCARSASAVTLFPFGFLVFLPVQCLPDAATKTAGSRRLETRRAASRLGHNNTGAGSGHRFPRPTARIPAGDREAERTRPPRAIGGRLGRPARRVSDQRSRDTPAEATERRACRSRRAVSARDKIKCSRARDRATKNKQRFFVQSVPARLGEARRLRDAVVPAPRRELARAEVRHKDDRELQAFGGMGGQQADRVKRLGFRRQCPARACPRRRKAPQVAEKRANFARRSAAATSARRSACQTPPPARKADGSPAAARSNQTASARARPVPQIAGQAEQIMPQQRRRVVVHRVQLGQMPAQLAPGRDADRVSAARPTAAFLRAEFGSTAPATSACGTPYSGQAATRTSADPAGSASRDSRHKQVFDFRALQQRPEIQHGNVALRQLRRQRLGLRVCPAQNRLLFDSAQPAPVSCCIASAMPAACPASSGDTASVTAGNAPGVRAAPVRLPRRKARLRARRREAERLHDRRRASGS